MTPRPAGRRDLAALIEDVEWMAASGESWQRAAARVGLTPAGLEGALRRARRADLVARLRAHGPSSARRRQGSAAHRNGAGR